MTNTLKPDELPSVVCVCTDGYDAALEVGHVYPVLPDASAAERRYIRVIDESGEDYLYPEECFITVERPSAMEETV